MTELKQIEVDAFFREMVTIQQLQDMTSPSLHYGTIINAINRQKLVCKKFGGGTDNGGVWLISLSSAKHVWPNRFKEKKS